MKAFSLVRPSTAYLRRLAVVLGTNEIASAVGLALHRDGWGVVLCHDPHPPVLRRKMAFHDALFGEWAEVEGVSGARADRTTKISKLLDHGHCIAVTQLGLLELQDMGPVDVLIDARMQKHRMTPDLRRLARLTVGLGPGFVVNANCDIAVETRPPKSGAIVRRGRTDAADGVTRLLGRFGSERFTSSQSQGRWRTAVEIGTFTSKGTVLGFLGESPVLAPLDGVIRGIVRNDTDVTPGVKLLEIDPRGQDAQWSGVDERGQTIATATLNAMRIHNARTAPVWEAAAFHPM